MEIMDEQGNVKLSGSERLEFYRLIGEGFRVVRENRVSTIDEVREKLKKTVEKS